MVQDSLCVVMEYVYILPGQEDRSLAAYKEEVAR